MSKGGVGKSDGGYRSSPRRCMEMVNNEGEKSFTIETTEREDFAVGVIIVNGSSQTHGDRVGFWQG